MGVLRTPNGDLLVEITLTEHDANLLVQHLHTLPVQTLSSDRIASIVDGSVKLARHHADRETLEAIARDLGG